MNFQNSVISISLMYVFYEVSFNFFFEEISFITLMIIHHYYIVSAAQMRRGRSPSVQEGRIIAGTIRIITNSGWRSFRQSDQMSRPRKTWTQSCLESNQKCAKVQRRSQTRNQGTGNNYGKGQKRQIRLHLSVGLVQFSWVYVPCIRHAG